MVSDQRHRTNPSTFNSDGDGFKDIEPIESRADDHTRYLWVPMHLFDVFLSLVDEKQLRRHILQLSIRICVPRRNVFGIFFNGQVPYCDLVVRTRGDKGTVLCGVPFDGCNCRFMPVECSHWRGLCPISATGRLVDVPRISKSRLTVSRIACPKF